MKGLLRRRYGMGVGELLSRMYRMGGNRLKVASAAQRSMKFLKGDSEPSGYRSCYFLFYV